MVVVSWLEEFDHDQEVMGSYPATSELFQDNLVT